MPTYRLAHSYGFNPLKAHRNIRCPCGSQKKAKACHGRPEALPVEDVKKINAYLAALAKYQEGRR